MDEPSTCRVCGGETHGRYFNAVVCLPCKSFFIRNIKEDPENLPCREKSGNCQLTVTNRSCKRCRLRRCIEIGMARCERPVAVQADHGQQLCRVCGDVSNGVHFGVHTCEGCKKFFRRSLHEKYSEKCANNTNLCIINPRNRNACKRCRLQRCRAVGMSMTAIKVGRPKKFKDSDDTSGEVPEYTLQCGSGSEEGSSSSLSCNDDSGVSEFLDAQFSPVAGTNPWGLANIPPRVTHLFDVAFEMNEANPAKICYQNLLSQLMDMESSMGFFERHRYDFTSIDTYWKIMQLPEDGIFTPQHQQLVEIVSAAFEFFADKMAEASSRDSTNPRFVKNGTPNIPEIVKRRIIHNVMYSSGFLHSIPGVEEILSEDKAIILRLSSMQHLCLIGCTHWYNPTLHTMKHIFDLALHEESSVYIFRQMLLTISSYISDLQLDVYETAMLASVMLVSPGTNVKYEYDLLKVTT